MNVQEEQYPAKISGRMEKRQVYVVDWVPPSSGEGSARWEVRTLSLDMSMRQRW